MAFRIIVRKVSGVLPADTKVGDIAFAKREEPKEMPGGVDGRFAKATVRFGASRKPLVVTHEEFHEHFRFAV